ncbi:MAG TPA: hypothetical protein VKA63_11085 [Candidatus Krumholzibacteria bacterium]|nr:hypothetical protein [Candidatus Krumholzibacteria bacterium]
MNSSRSTVKMTIRSYWFRIFVSFLLLCGVFLYTIPSVSQAKIIYESGQLQGDIEASSGSSSSGDPDGGELKTSSTWFVPTIFSTSRQTSGETASKKYGSRFNKTAAPFRLQWVEKIFKVVHNWFTFAHETEH